MRAGEDGPPREDDEMRAEQPSETPRPTCHTQCFLSGQPGAGLFDEEQSGDEVGGGAGRSKDTAVPATPSESLLNAFQGYFLRRG